MRRLVAVVSLLVLSAVLIAGTDGRAAQEATPAPAPSPVVLTPLLEAWLAAFNAGDADGLLALMTEDALWEEPAIRLAAQGPEQIQAHLEGLFTATPDIAYAVMNAAVTDDQAVVEWVATGTYQEEFPGLPPATGQPFPFRGVSVFALVDGRVARYTEYWDAYTFLVQLGALSPPGTPAP